MVGWLLGLLLGGGMDSVDGSLAIRKPRPRVDFVDGGAEFSSRYAESSHRKINHDVANMICCRREAVLMTIPVPMRVKILTCPDCLIDAVMNSPSSLLKIGPIEL